MNAQAESAFAARGLDHLRGLHLRAWSALGRAPARGERRKFAAVVLKLDRIGDFVLALSAIRLVTLRFGEERCALVISPAVAELARREFPRATLVVLPAFVRHKRAWPGWWRARAVLSALECDHLVGLRHQRWDCDELALAWVRATHVHAVVDPKAAAWVRHRRSGPPGAGTPYRERVVAAGACRELELHRQVLAGVLGAEPTTEELLPRFAQPPVATGDGHAVVVPFASTPIKDLPMALLKTWRAGAPVGAGERIFIVGSAEQRARLAACARELSAVAAGPCEVVTPPSLVDLVALINGAAWVLTADTAAAHIATALDRPTVVLLGGGTFGQFGPWQRSARQRWLSHPLPCFNCGWQCVHPEPWCLTRLTAPEVAAALRGVRDQPAGFTAK